MATNARLTQWLLAAAALGVLVLIVSVLSFLPGAPVTSTAAPQPARPAPVVAARPPLPAPAPHASRIAPAGVRHDYIVQAISVARAREAVIRVGGIVTGELDIIRAVGAALDERELAALWEKPVTGLRVYDDATVTASGTGALPETYYPTEVGASPMHMGGLTGRGVTVAVLDSSVWREKGPLQRTSYGRDPQVIAQYDVILAREHPEAYKSPQYEKYDKYDRDIDDLHGHGTHVSGSSRAAVSQ